MRQSSLPSSRSRRRGLRRRPGSRVRASGSSSITGGSGGCNVRKPGEPVDVLGASTVLVGDAQAHAAIPELRVRPARLDLLPVFGATLRAINWIGSGRIPGVIPVECIGVPGLLPRRLMECRSQVRRWCRRRHVSSFQRTSSIPYTCSPRAGHAIKPPSRVGGWTLSSFSECVPRGKNVRVLTVEGAF